MWKKVKGKKEHKDKSGEAKRRERERGDRDRQAERQPTSQPDRHTYRQREKGWNRKRGGRKKSARYQ